MVMFASLHLSEWLPEMLFVFFGSSCALAATTLATPNPRLHANAACCIVLFIEIGLGIDYWQNSNRYGQHMIYCASMLWLLYFIFSFHARNNRHFAKQTAWIVIATVAIEVVWGIAQSIGLVSNVEKMFAVGGSSGNPGALAGYLAAASPLLLSVIIVLKRRKQYENLFYILLSILVFALYLLVITKQRGAWIACLVGCGAVLISKYHKRIAFLFSSRLRKAISIVCLCAIVVAGSIALYKYKEDSAFGRLLVWKVATQTPHENLIMGNGIGHFEAEYGKWQAAYFEKGGSEKELYVADYVTTAYNEFVETALEQGIVASILLGMLFVVAVTGRWRRLSAIELGTKASIVAIAVLSFCSYPLNVLQISLYMVFCLAVVSNHQQRRIEITNKFLRIAMLTCIAAAACCTAWGGISHARGLRLLQEGRLQVFEQNNLPKGIETYLKAEELLTNNGLLYFYLGSAYMLSEEREKAIDALGIACRQSSNPNAFILLGNAYKETNNVELSEQAYKTAAYMQPTRLYPKYLLAKLHNEIGDKATARYWASKVVDTKEKVPTTAAKEIKEEMLLLLRSDSTQHTEHLKPMPMN